MTERRFRAWCFRLLGSLRRSRRDQDLADEIDSHLQLHIDDNIRAGMTPKLARREAILRFGPVESIKESYRDRRGAPVIDNVVRDICWGWRVLRRDPGFAFLAVLTLALGIAATTAVFSIVDAVLLRPLPYPDADRLVVLNTVAEEDPERISRLSTGIVAALQERAGLLESVVAYQEGSATLLGGEEPRLVAVGHATAGFFELFGGTAMHGRTFQQSDHATGAPRVAVLSHALWQSAWGGDPEIFGTAVTLSDEVYLLVGVMPPGFRQPEAAGGSRTGPGVDLWTALPLDRDVQPEYIGIGRLAPGATIASARAEADPIFLETAAGPFRWRARLTPLLEQTVGDVGEMLSVFLGGAVLLLLIACANVANLLLSRGVQRRRELVLRAALGAHRSRVARQLLIESMLLSAMGALAGTALAYAAVDIFQAFDPGTIPRSVEVAVDGRILAFALAVAGLTGVLFGLAPVLQLSRHDPAFALREGGPGFTDGRSARRVRSVLVVGQTALALMLLVGAGLLVHSFVALARVDAGFDPEGLAMVEVRLPLSFAERTRAAPFFDELLGNIRAAIGSDAVALTSAPPFAPSFSFALVPEGWEETAQTTRHPIVRSAVVSTDYLALMGIPIVAGRPFDRRDSPDADRVGLVNEAFVRTYWPGEDAVGKRIGTGGGMLNAPSLTVVGVVGDVRASPGADAIPEVFVPVAQVPYPTMTVVARTGGNPAELIPTMRAAAWALDPDLPIRRATTMDAAMSELVAGPRFYALLSSSFAGAALLLALVGVYGTAAHAAGRRRRELGIRVALGAESRAIVSLVMRDGLALAVAGVLIGIAGARLVSGLLSGLLFGVTEGDVATLVGCALLFSITSGVASMIPAVRAAHVDPVAALQADR
jgi:putative ABC transport system permease protein